MNIIHTSLFGESITIVSSGVQVNINEENGINVCGLEIEGDLSLVFVKLRDQIQVSKASDEVRVLYFNESPIYEGKGFNISLLPLLVVVDDFSVRLNDIGPIHAFLNGLIGVRKLREYRFPISEIHIAFELVHGTCDLPDQEITPLIWAIFYRIRELEPDRDKHLWEQ